MPRKLENSCVFISVQSDLVDRDRRLDNEDWMVHDVTVQGKIPVFHPAMLPEVLTPEFFGTPNDADNLQACFDEGGDIRLDGVYQTGSTVLRIERQSSVVAGPDSGIYTDGYNEAYYLPIIEVLAEDVRLEGLRLFSSADYKPYIDVRNNYVNELGHTRSVYYHYFYFTNPVNCTFSHIEAGAVGDSDFCNSDIFHFNYFISGEPLGGPVTVTDATALDGCFYRFAQCNTQVQAHFVDCSAQLRDQLCLLSNEATASFENCDFLITRGSKQTYGLRCSSAFNRILLKNCRITDLSEGYLFSDGIIAENCVFKLKAMNINAHDTVGGVEFWNCKFHADRLICIAPDKEGFRAEYHNCSFVFATSPEYLIQKGSAASILVSGGSVENCEALFKDRLNEKSHVDTSLK